VSKTVTECAYTPEIQVQGPGTGIVNIMVGIQRRGEPQPIRNSESSGMAAPSGSPAGSFQVRYRMDRRHHPQKEKTAASDWNFRHFAETNSHKTGKLLEPGATDMSFPGWQTRGKPTQTDCTADVVLLQEGAGGLPHRGIHAHCTCSGGPHRQAAKPTMHRLVIQLPQGPGEPGAVWTPITLPFGGRT
jgi:hypothetical protein